jgi:acid stress chaperone HdeA
MKTLACVAVVSIIVSGGSALADTMTQSPKPSTAAPSSAKSVKPMKMTCEEFLSLDEVTRPQVVYWSEGFNRKGKPDDAVFDIDRTTSLVPVLVESCQKAPKSSYWAKFKAEWRKIF